MVSRSRLEYVIKQGVTVLFFIFGCLILWAYVSYLGYLPELGLATRFLNKLLRLIGSPLGMFRALSLLLILAIIAVINGLMVFAAIIYRLRRVGTSA